MPTSQPMPEPTTFTEILDFPQGGTLSPPAGGAQASVAPEDVWQRAMAVPISARFNLALASYSAGPTQFGPSSAPTLVWAVYAEHTPGYSGPNGPPDPSGVSVQTCQYGTVVELYDAATGGTVLTSMWMPPLAEIRFHH